MRFRFDSCIIDEVVHKMKIDLSRLSRSGVLIVNGAHIQNVKGYEIKENASGGTELVLTITVPEKEFVEFVLN